jgi:hypothetical protein
MEKPEVFGRASNIQFYKYIEAYISATIYGIEMIGFEKNDINSLG